MDEVAAHLTASGAVTDQDAIESELGDLLFAVANLCRKTGVHGALALDRANLKFTRRYAAMEQLAAARGLDFAALSLTAKDVLWDAIKRGE